MDFSIIKNNLIRLGYEVSCFNDASAVTKYLSLKIKNKTVGFGGSVTLEQLGLYDALSVDNTVYWHQKNVSPNLSSKVRKSAVNADIYVSSVNAIAESGEIINIDYVCNRLAGICYGNEKTYLIVGKNKITSDLNSAIYRARNVASPLNAKRLNRKTPCAIKADKCYDCDSEDRICSGLLTLWRKPALSNIEVILVNENLGY